ncbi:HupE/UreJ family protein [Sessilibacter sp. MAH2]
MDCSINLIRPLINRPLTLLTIATGLIFLMVSMFASAHGVDDSTRRFLTENTGVQFVPFLYIGAKHMFTGYDHLLFLVGLIFFLYNNKDVLIYVTTFTLGHSLTLLAGVAFDLSVNAYLIDAIIGLSVFYKGFDNLGGFKKLLGFQPNTKIAVFIFGLFHGFGLATKLQEFQLPADSLLPNLIAFNIGVELGQFSALIFIVLLLNFLRRMPAYQGVTVTTNSALMSAGLILMAYQMTGFFVA